MILFMDVRFWGGGDRGALSASRSGSSNKDTMLSLTHSFCPRLAGDVVKHDLRQL
jgi:hypothetical protein